MTSIISLATNKKHPANSSKFSALTERRVCNDKYRPMKNKKIVGEEKGRKVKTDRKPYAKPSFEENQSLDKETAATYYYYSVYYFYAWI
ncbi:uncharacterized protein METZ01_LOCUS320771 [marine metagenome]|uniref:Uncharacterized protein n=1 Tax=marine metagenome TaxID=408172 RepID=A0A382P510_9ZZZZ